MVKESIHLKGLNGLRAIAAITVLLSHVFFNTFGNWGIPDIRLPIFESGVTLFFVISGFLITFLLLKEIDKTDTVQIKKFYLRRILRIWPIYYLFLLLAIGVSMMSGRSGDILNPKLWYYVFFMANIPFLSANGIWIIVHYWSIGVEEQFYLFWPWLMKLMKHKVLKISVSVLVIWLGLKYGSWLLFTNHSLAYRFFSVTSFQSMMMGAIGAILYAHKNSFYLKITIHRLTQALVWIFFLFFGLFESYIPAVFKNEVVSFFSLFLIMGQVGAAKKIIDLESPFFDFIGKISYGIYVIHPLVIYLLSRIWIELDIQIPIFIEYIIIYLLVTFITVGIAWLSYHYFESPFLKLKSRLAIVKSKNTMVC